MHAREVVGLNEGCEPFDICQEVREGSEMGWQFEDDPNLGNTKAWDLGLVG